MIKTCSSCKVPKDEDQNFYKQHGKSLSHCKSCSKLQAKNWRKANRRKVWQKWDKKYRQARDLRTPEKQMLRAARNRARSRGRPFTISLRDIVIPEICPVFGTPMRITREKGRAFVDDAPSLDAVIPELGYTKENIQIISWKANRIKGAATAEDHLRIYQYITNHLSKLPNS